MATARVRFVRAGFGRVLGLFLGLLVSVPASAFSVADLMRELGRHQEGVATFSEKKYISILDEPVESSGELSFTAPARLEKRTIKPRQETLVLDGDTLTVQKGRRKHVLQLKEYPEVAGMIESIRATLTGNRAALEKVYHLALQGSRSGWTLVLTPLDARVGRLVARIRMEGAEDRVGLVEVLQADGDRSVMQITPKDTP